MIVVEDEPIAWGWTPGLGRAVLANLKPTISVSGSRQYDLVAKTLTVDPTLVSELHHRRARPLRACKPEYLAQGQQACR